MITVPTYLTTSITARCGRADLSETQHNYMTWRESLQTNSKQTAATKQTTFREFIILLMYVGIRNVAWRSRLSDSCRGDQAHLSSSPTANPTRPDELCESSCAQNICAATSYFASSKYNFVGRVGTTKVQQIEFLLNLLGAADAAAIQQPRRLNQTYCSFSFCNTQHCIGPRMLLHWPLSKAYNPFVPSRLKFPVK